MIRELKGQEEGILQGMAAFRAPWCNQCKFSLFSWFCFSLCQLESQAPQGKWLVYLHVKGNFFPEVTEKKKKISCAPLFLTGSHAWLFPVVGEKQNLMKFVDPALELGMMSPALEVHRHRVGWRELFLRKSRVWLLEGWMNSKEPKQQMPTPVMLAQQTGLRHLPSLFYAL